MTSKDLERDFIPQGLYDQIANSIPIVSVEGIIVIDNALLMLKRKNNPAKGQWWFPGGRMRKGESLEEALRREIKEETGLEISHYKLINVYSRVFPERHDITIAYLCECKKGIIIINDEHSEYKLFRSTPEGLHPYINETLKDFQIKNNKQ